MTQQAEAAQGNDVLRDYFYGWQCRLRQHSMRKLDGRPSEGTQALVNLKISDRDLGPVNTVLVQRAPEEITTEFRHIVKRTFDPNEWQKAATKLLSSAYFQHPKDFADGLIATFLLESELAAVLLREQECVLRFSQYQQSFVLHCRVTELDESDPEYLATYWHNHMFNPTLPAVVRALRFSPDWAICSAEPSVERR